MLLEGRAASDDPWFASDDRSRDPLHVVFRLPSDPAHKVLAHLELRREALATHIKNQVQIFFFVFLDAGEQTAGEAPLAEQMVGRRRLHRLVGDNPDGFSKTEIRISDFTADLSA